ncbi:MAG TPA: acetoin utilization protein AcuC [Methylococcaceae bacterium]|nr:acetoin utilization protein AcuC [Methylococcaceae bacterium]
MAVRVYYGQELARYGFGNGHPFGPDRLDAFEREFTRRGLDKKVEIASPVAATEEQLTLFHTPGYIRLVKELSETGVGYLDYGDTPVFPGVFEAACYVVGSVLDALRFTLSGPKHRSFVPIAGLHHARRDRAGGFCVFNDIGVAIETLRRFHGLQRIAYVDIDAHHGDGVFYSFVSDPDLFVADIHEDGRYLYPGTGRQEENGEGSAKGTKLNLPMPPGADERAFRQAWIQVEDFVRAADPEFILLQAGADSLAGDPIADLEFSVECHAHATRRLCAIADDLCDGRLVGTGGGGYNRSNLALAWNAVVEAMLD